MGFRVLISLLVLSFFGFQANAATTKTKAKKKVESTKLPEKNIQVEQTQVVKAAPLEQPESSMMRQKRQQMEMETEEEFIQKLEQARIEDEKARQQQINDQQFRTIKNDEAEAFMQPVADEPVTVDQVVKTNVVVNELKEKQNSFYLGLLAGGVSNQAGNIPSLNGAGGVSLGVALAQEAWLEASFFYSFMQADQSYLPKEDIDQYSVTVGPKYTFGLSNNWLTPSVGALIGYTRRQYNSNENGSNSMDAGLSAGVDLALNKAIKIGLEGRYMTNLDYQKDNPTNATQKALVDSLSGSSSQALEKFDYTVFMARLKMML